VVAFTDILTPKDHHISTIEVETEISMNKAIMAIMIAVVIYLLGDPGGDPMLDEVATAISLLSMPWITS
jgi:hypothetical protein